MEKEKKLMAYRNDFNQNIIGFDEFIEAFYTIATEIEREKDGGFRICV